MPLSFEGQQFEFQDLVTHLKTSRKDIENPEAFVGSLEQEQGVALDERFFEDDVGKWGRFFLISPARNVNKWRVTADSIPKRIKTFEGRPFISEPNLEHFGAENMSSPLEIIRKQDEFRMGIIKKVTFDSKTGEGDAVVLFDKTPEAERVWLDMKAGNAFFVSPAIAGEFVEVNGERIYQDWFGLHLARVTNPAYGVFHASIKATCEGDERKCVQNLIATASTLLESNDTFNFSGFSCAKNMSMNDPETPFEETEAGKAIAGIATELDGLKKKVETSFEQLENKTSDPSPKGQTTPVKSNISDGDQSQASATEDVKPDPTVAQEMDDLKKKSPVLAQEMENLKEQAQAADEDLRERLTEDVLETEKAEGELMDEPKTAAEEETRKVELEKMDTASLKATSVAATASLNKVSAMASKFGKTSVATQFQKTRLVRMPNNGVGTASVNGNQGYKNMQDIKESWL